jgi:MFS transporter, OFA family, oxalate/formate antiporter
MDTNKVFYGWWVLAALFIIYAITNGVILNTLPQFYPELIKEYGWTRDEVTRPAQLLFLLVALSSPFVGYMTNRVDIKMMMYIGTALILGGFLVFSKISSLGMLAGAYALFAFGITLAGIIPSMKIITHWFVKSRGLAVGILLVGSSMGGAIFSQIAGKFIAADGWRSAMLYLGVIAALTIIIPLILAVKVSPASVGQNPDGALTPAESNTINSVSSQVSYGDFLKSKIFYLLLFITGAMWFCIVGVIQHQSLIFKDLDTTVQTKDIISAFFICSILGKIIFGKLSDLRSKRDIMYLAVCNLALGALILVFLKKNPDLFLWLYAIVFGIGFSGTFTMIQLLIAEYYKGEAYGKALGLFTMVDTLAGVAGIMTLGIMSTKAGNYDQAMWVLLIISVIASICVLFVPRKTTT